MTCNLTLGGVVVPHAASIDLTQVYTTFGGYTSPPIRTCNGRAIYQERWRKERVQSSGNGPIPPGLAGLDYSQPLEMLCYIAKADRASSLVVTLPANKYRTDAGHEPFALAIFDNTNWWTQATSTRVGDTLTIDPVVGAVDYLVLYRPRLQVYAEYPEVSGTGLAARWSFTAEET